MPGEVRKQTFSLSRSDFQERLEMAAIYGAYYSPTARLYFDTRGILNQDIDADSNLWWEGPRVSNNTIRTCVADNAHIWLNDTSICA